MYVLLFKICNFCNFLNFQNRKCPKLQNCTFFGKFFLHNKNFVEKKSIIAGKSSKNEKFKNVQILILYKGYDILKLDIFFVQNRKKNLLLEF